MISRARGSHGGPRNSSSLVLATSDSAKLLVQFDSPAPETAALKRSRYRVISECVRIPPDECRVEPNRPQSIGNRATSASMPETTSSPSLFPHPPQVPHLNAVPYPVELRKFGRKTKYPF